MLPRKTNTTQSSLIQRAKADQLQYELPRSIIQKELDTRGVKRQTDIWIYPLFGARFLAVVGAHDSFVYIFEVDGSYIKSVEQKPCLGVRPNGSLLY